MLESPNGMCGFCGKGASEVVSKSGEGGSKLPGSEKLLYLLFYNRLFMDYWASFSVLWVIPTNGPEDLVCSFKCSGSDNEPRLVY